MKQIIQQKYLWVSSLPLILLIGLVVYFLTPKDERVTVPSPTPSHTNVTNAALPTPSSVEGWKRYVNEEHNYSFSYPKNWYVTSSGKDIDILSFDPKIMKHDTEVKVDGYMVVEIDALSEEQADYFLMPSNTGNPNIEPAGTIGGKPIFLNKLHVDTQSIAYDLVDGNKVFSILFSGDLTHANFEIAKSIVSTLQFNQ